MGHRDVLLSNLDRDDAEELRNLLRSTPYGGRIRNTETTLLVGHTVVEAISLIRRGWEGSRKSPIHATW